MSVTYDKTSGDYVVKGFENGISDDPYTGIGDLKNINIISVPREASVNFATSAISQQPSSGNVTSANAGADTVTITGSTFDSGAAIVFAGGSLPTGIVAGTTYWAVGSGGVFQLFTDYALGSLLNITSDGTGTWASINMGQPKYFTYSSQDSSPAYWMVDATGYVWSNKRTTADSPFYWTYTGNRINNDSHGNGIVYYTGNDGTPGSATTGYVFVFSDSSIDYTATGTVSWQYQWSPSAGTVGSYNANPTQRLKSANGTSAIHEAIVAPDNKVYYCDGSFIGRFYQTAVGTAGNAFVPTDSSKYIFDNTKVLPLTDTAQCLAPLGNNLLIGGIKNVVYPWDTFSQLPNYPILLPEYNVAKMVTVNTTTFVFVGNRGRIYYTNGSQAQLYKKIPDFLSGTVEPYFTWGGVCSNKNQLYFSAYVTTNAGVAVTTYGGVWGVDLDSKAIRLTNTLSYQSTIYNGFATAIIPNFGSGITNPAGTGLFIGWDSKSSTYGIDTTVSTPYAGSNTVSVGTISSDYVPIGTYLKPATNGRVEFKLSVPMVAGESVQLLYRQNFVDAFTPIATFNYSGTAGANNYSGVSTTVPFQNSQWIQLQAILISTASSPSYTRLTEFRLGN